MVPEERFELSRLSPYASETYAYTNSATPAISNKRVSIAISKLYVNRGIGFLTIYSLYFIHAFSPIRDKS